MRDKKNEKELGKFSFQNGKGENIIHFTLQILRAIRMKIASENKIVKNVLECN